MNAQDNVVGRLKQQLARARSMGLNVRLEMLDGEQATWCEIAGTATLFVDISQTAAEQLHQVEQTLAAYASAESAAETEHGHTAAPPQTGCGREKRAA